MDMYIYINNKRKQSHFKYKGNQIKDQTAWPQTIMIEENGNKSNGS